MSTSTLPVNDRPRGRYLFGEFILDLETGFLLRNGDEVSLRRKTFDVLTYLVLHPGRVIPKDELARAVWADVAVTDNSLAQCLLEIRRALDDGDQQLVRTVARRGYLFNAQVTISPAAAASGPAAEPEGGPPTISQGPAASDAEGKRLRRISSAGFAVVAVIALAGAVTAWRTTSRAPARAAMEESPIQLTDFNDSATAPAISHDGRMLAFIRGGGFGKVGAPSSQVYVKLLDGGPPVQLTHDQGDKTHPVFSPDDSRIVYTTLLSGLRWDSWQVPVLGGDPQPFLPNASGLEWIDDRHVVYSTIKAGIHMGIATSTESRADYREIYFPTRHDGMAHRSSRSPDGKWLLVVEMSAGTWLPCRLVPADGSGPGVAVSPSGAQCTTASWSPDGQWMYFSSNAGGAFHLWRQRFPDGAPEQITFGPTEQEGTAVSPDGRHLITSMGLQQASIWIHDANGDRKLTHEGFAAQPTLSASGTQMFYLVRTRLSWGESSGELWELDLESGARRHLLPGVVISSYSVSSDQRHVVYSPAADPQADGIWIADLDQSKPPRRLVRGTGLRGFFGGPGEIIYAGGDGRLYRIDEEGAAARQVSPYAVSYLVTVSRDGRWAEAILPRPSHGVGTTSLWFVSLRGEQSLEVCNETCSVGPRSFQFSAPFTWSADSRWLFVNLSFYGRNTPRTIVLPYRSDASPTSLWPAGLTSEASVASNPGARVIEATSTSPGAHPDDYLFQKTSTLSNLYRIRVPE